MTELNMPGADLDKAKSLAMHSTDYITSALKAGLGAVPYAGSLLAELAGSVIPNQRIDRIVKFAEVLETRLSRIEREFAQGQLKDEYFSDLMEEGLRQAARSLSDERRQYIANLIFNSLSSSEIEYHESKHLLKILDELNDIEIIWLRFYLVSKMNGDNEFRDKHKDILKPVTKIMSASQAVRDKGTLQDSYKEHLGRLGLLEKADNKYSLSSLGRLLLREIGLMEAKEA
jgi:hypothetical protein